MEEQGVIMIEQRALVYSKEHQQLAFRHEFYETAGNGQIRDDLVSYLAEYRFEVSEFEYKFGIVNDKLVDPNSREPMTDKAKKAIETRKKNNLGVVREKAELEGLLLLEDRIKENPTGTVVWFSPPGAKEDGYGKYGFAYAGKREADSLKMTAIRLENPSISDFNLIANAMWGKAGEKTAEDFLKNPQVLDIPLDKAKDFIHGVFEIKPEESNTVFQKALNEMAGVIKDSTHIFKNGSFVEKQRTIAVLENMAIELRQRFSFSHEANVVFFADYKAVNLYAAMQMQRYVNNPPPVPGSCGMSGKIESSNILGKLTGSSENDLLNKSNQEWFTCPKCTYKADGPVGNKCPGCGLTKEQYVEDGGANCD